MKFTGSPSYHRITLGSLQSHTHTINKLKEAKHYDPVKDGEKSLDVGKVGSVVNQPPVL